jgi:hypothetical protein
VIHEHGITPDIPVPMSEEEWARIMIQRSQSPLEGTEDVSKKADDHKSDEKPISSTPPPKAEDSQLNRAVDLLKGINAFVKQAD